MEIRVDVKREVYSVEGLGLPWKAGSREVSNWYSSKHEQRGTGSGYPIAMRGKGSPMIDVKQRIATPHASPFEKSRKRVEPVRNISYVETLLIRRAEAVRQK